MDSLPGKKTKQNKTKQPRYLYICSKQGLFCLGGWSLVLSPKSVQFPLWKYSRDAFFCIFEGRCIMWLVLANRIRAEGMRVISRLKFLRVSAPPVTFTFFCFGSWATGRWRLLHPESLSEDDVQGAAKLAHHGSRRRDENWASTTLKHHN